MTATTTTTTTATDTHEDICDERACDSARTLRIADDIVRIACPDDDCTCACHDAPGEDGTCGHGYAPMGCELEMFTDAYVRALLWSELYYCGDEEYGPCRHDDGACQGHSVDDHYGPEELDGRAWSVIRADCEDFVNQVHPIIDALSKHPETSGRMGWSQAGQDFALTRNGHGAGFWDRGIGDAGDRLTDYADAAGEMHVYPLSDEAITVE